MQWLPTSSFACVHRMAARISRSACALHCLDCVAIMTNMKVCSIVTAKKFQFMCSHRGLRYNITKSSWCWFLMYSWYNMQWSYQCNRQTAQKTVRPIATVLMMFYQETCTWLRLLLEREVTSDPLACMLVLLWSHWLLQNSTSWSPAHHDQWC